MHITKINIGVIAVIQNENKEILMMQRKKEPAKGMWSIPGGKVEQYERLEDTVTRELREELAIDVEVIKLIGIIEDISKDKEIHWLMPVYKVKIINGVPINQEPQKHGNVTWFTLDNIPENSSFMTKEVVKLLK